MTTTKKRSRAAPQGGRAKKSKVANNKTVQLPRLPDNIWRKIYASTNWRSRLSLRGATKAVHELPAPQRTVAFVRRRIIQLYKKLRSMIAKVNFTGASDSRIRRTISNYLSLVDMLLAYYPSKPAVAAQLVEAEWTRHKLGNDPALQRLSDENTNVSNAERVNKLKPYILKVVHLLSEEFDEHHGPIVRKTVDNGLAQKGATHKNANAHASRKAHEYRQYIKGPRQSFWKYRDLDNNNALTISQLNERLRIHRNARRTARIQRRDQRRQERGEPEWLPPNNTNNNSTWTATASPPPWVTLKSSSGRTRSLGNLVRASVAHPAVALWTLRRHT